MTSVKAEVIDNEDEPVLKNKSLRDNMEKVDAILKQLKTESLEKESFKQNYFVQAPKVSFNAAKKSLACWERSCFLQKQMTAGGRATWDNRCYH